MSTDFRLLIPIRMADLFDGRPLRALPRNNRNTFIAASNGHLPKES